MFLVFILVLLSLGVGIFMSAYSSFFPFLQNIGHITEYNSAYYSAVSEVERGLLVLKYRDPGFQWSWGVMWSTWRGPLSDQDRSFVTGNDQWTRWNISSRTTSIPASGQGDTDPLLQAPDSRMYNAVNYHDLETFLLSVDSVSGSENYYSGDVHVVSYFSWDSFSGVFRLPPVVYATFGSGQQALLCADASNSACDADGDGVSDESILNRALAGMYNANDYFKIIPMINIFYYSGMQINTDYDTALRESLANATAALIFGNSYTPIFPHGESLSWQNVVSSVASVIEPQTFTQLFQNPSVSDLQFSFGLVALLRSYVGAIYPYLEYQFTFPQEISDRYFTIDGDGRNGNYDVHVLIKKPTVPGTVWGGFTVIF